VSRKPLLVVRAHVNPEMMDEFERWYHEVHLVSMLRIPGIVAAFRIRSPRTGPNWLAVFKFVDESVVQKAFASSEAEQARRDWERWLPYVSEVSVEVYTPLMALPAYRHWN
jgi:antibiotic biosynthesis monooxygenase (ABM) superfamily enzyme